MPRAHSLLFLCLLTGLTAGLSAQTYTAQKVKFTQMGNFTQQQLEDAAGVHAGASLTSKTLAEAAQRLIDTGYFEDVSASLEGKVTAATIVFTDKVLPAGGMLRVGFRNLVWLTPDEIDAAIRTQFPLYNGYLPENSAKQDVLKTALIAGLAAKSVPADVDYETLDPTLRHPTTEIVFSVSKPVVRVGAIHLGGVSAALAPYVQKSVNATARTKYIEGPADETTADRILAPLLDAGYAEATLTNVTRKPAPATDGSVAVDLTAQLNAGEIYHVSAMNFAGAPLLSADAFAASAKLHVGDVASRKALLETLLPLDTAYRSKGYMDVAIDSGAVLDKAAHSVAYTVSVRPGEQYRVKTVAASGLDAAGKADFDRGFLVKPGDLYNPAYVAGFLKNNTALKGLAGYAAAYKAYADPATHMVDVVVEFYRMAH